MKRFTTEDVEAFLQSESATPAIPAETHETTETNGFDTSWEDFLIQSDTEPTTNEKPAENVNLVPHPGFTAVNSTLDSSREFTARQILLNAELTPASSPERSPEAQTESDSASPTGQTPFDQTLFDDTPAASLDPPTQQPVQDRTPLADVTSQSSSNENSTTTPAPEKRPRGRPKGWRKHLNQKPATDSLPVQKPRISETKVRKPRKEGPREEDQWSVRIRTSIKDAMMEHIAKGIPPNRTI
jgi:hypothetical protein